MFKPNPDFEKDLAAQRDYLDGVREAAEPAAQAAQRFVSAAGGPYMPRKGARTVEAVVDGDQVRIVNPDHGAHLMEFGSAKTPVTAPLRRGARAAGLRLEEQPRQ